MAKTFFDLREAWETQKGVETKRKANTDVEEAKGKLVKNMRVKHIHNGSKGTVVKGGDKAGGRVEVEWDDGKTTVAAGKYLEPIKESVELEEVNKIGEFDDESKAKAFAKKHSGYVKSTTFKSRGNTKYYVFKESVELEEGKKLRNVLSDREFEKSMKKALADKSNYKGGKINWNFIDADVYMELSAKGYDLRHPSINYMDRFDKLADKLDPANVKESIELEEAKNHAAADELMAYAKKYGGMDKKDFMKAAGYLNNYRSSGSPRAVADLVKMVNDMDTDPRDKVLLTIKKHDPSMFKSVMKKAGLEMKEEVELEEVRKYTPPTKAEIEADKRKDQRGKPRSSMSAKSAKKSVYKNMMGGLKEGMDQKKFSAGAKAMKAYAQKNGGVDKKDFMEVSKLLDQIGRVNILQAGQLLSRLNRIVDGMDTDVRERIFIELKKVGLVESVDESTKAYGDTMRKQARDRQQANMKPGEMDKLKKIRAMLDKEKKK